MKTLLNNVALVKAAAAISTVFALAGCVKINHYYYENGNIVQTASNDNTTHKPTPKLGQ